MPHRRYLIPVCSGILLAACGSEASRHAAILTDGCVELGDDRPICACIADTLVATLDQETLADLSDYMTSLVAAKDDDARTVIAMSAFQNPTLVTGLQSVEQAANTCGPIVAAAEGEGDDDASGNSNLAGTWVPQLGDVPASERRLAAAAADRRWEFTADGKVTTHSQAGARNWTYQVRGKEILLQGADSRTRGERRRFTWTNDGNCIWDGSGNSSVDMRFCRQ